MQTTLSMVNIRSDPKVSEFEFGQLPHLSILAKIYSSHGNLVINLEDNICLSFETTT